MKILLVGAGGVGGYLAGKLTQKYPDISVIARGAHLAALRENGLTVLDDGVPFTVRLSHVSDQPPKEIQDAVFFCTKGYGLAEACALVRPAVGKQTLLIPVLNGINMHRRLSAALPEGKALLGSIYIYANILAPGVIQKNGPMIRLLLGAPEGGAPAQLHALAKMLNDCGVPTEISGVMQTESWSKWVILLSNGQANAYFNAPVGEIRGDPEKMRFVNALFDEAVSVAKAEGVALPDSLRARLQKLMDDLPYDSTSSLARDLASPGRQTELDIFAGELCRLAGQHGIDAPANRAVLARFCSRL